MRGIERPQPFLRQLDASAGGTSEAPRHPEYNKDYIMERNHSDQAKDRLRRWNAAYGSERITLIRTCPDSRVMTPDPTSEITIPYIAAGGNVSATDSLLLLPAISNKVVMGHIATARFRMGVEMPKGCGGGEAKQAQVQQQQQNGNPQDKKKSEKVSGIDFYIREHVSHPDPVVNAALMALFASMNNPRGIPIIGVVQDHMAKKEGKTFKTLPVAAFVRTGEDAVDIIMHPRLAPYVLSSGRVEYDPRRIYEDGIPTISIGSLPEESAEFIQKCDFMADEMEKKYPKLAHMQWAQEGPLLALNGDVRHKGVMLPGVGDVPGGMFEVFSARTRSNIGIVTPPKAFITSLRQLEYPIRQSTANWGQEDADFGLSDTLWINSDSNNLDISKKIGRILSGKTATDWFRPWHERGGKVVLTCSTNGFITDGIDY